MDIRFRLVLITLVGLLAAAVWTVPQWWPLLYPESVTAEVFPGLALESQADYIALPNSVKATYEEIREGDDDVPPNPEWALALVGARLTQEDRLAPDAAELFEPAAGSLIVAQGQWEGMDNVRQVQGEFIIYQRPDGSQILRLPENFRSTRAPGVHLVLTRNPDPMGGEGVGIDYLDIGPLRGNVGAQTYAVPQSADYDIFPVLALYAPEFDGLLGAATIQVP